MINSSGFKAIVSFAVFFTFLITPCAQAEDYEWLKSHNHESIFVFTDFNGCDFIEDKLIETVKRSFSRSKIIATLSNSMAFQTTNNGDDSTFELLDEELISGNKIILHIYGKCIRYTSGYIYQFDIHFGVKDQKYSQALLYSTPRHSVVGVDAITGIDKTFRELMKYVVEDYLSANQ